MGAMDGAMDGATERAWVGTERPATQTPAPFGPLLLSRASFGLRSTYSIGENPAASPLGGRRMYGTGGH